MRIRVDKENDSLYFRLDESRIVESEEVQPGVILDYDEKDQDYVVSNNLICKNL